MWLPHSIKIYLSRIEYDKTIFTLLFGGNLIENRHEQNKCKPWSQCQMLSTHHTAHKWMIFIVCGNVNEQSRHDDNYFEDSIVEKLRHFCLVFCVRVLRYCKPVKLNISILNKGTPMLVYKFGGVSVSVSQIKTKSFYCQPQLYNFHVFILTHETQWWVALSLYFEQKTIDW